MALVSCQNISKSLRREATRYHSISLRYYGGEEGRSGGGRGGGGGGPRERWTHSPICADFRFSKGERIIMRVFHPGCIGTAPTCRPRPRMWRIPRVCKNCRWSENKSDLRDWHPRTKFLQFLNPLDGQGRAQKPMYRRSLAGTSCAEARWRGASSQLWKKSKTRGSQGDQSSQTVTNNSQLINY